MPQSNNRRTGAHVAAGAVLLMQCRRRPELRSGSFTAERLVPLR